MDMRKFILRTSLIAITAVAIFAAAQDIEETGTVLSVSEQTITVAFENRTLNTGDEIAVVRRINIVDPISGNIKGGRNETIATGVVISAGIDRSTVSILWRSSRYNTIELTDQVQINGVSADLERAKSIVGKMQNLRGKSKEVEIDFGEEEGISQGDKFIIQRTEYTFDPDTNEIIDTEVVEVGRGLIKTVGETTSLGEILVNPGYEIDFDTDEIVIDTAELEAQVIRPRDEVVGRIQELVSDERLDIDVGDMEEINEGDLFLIQRTESVIDPETNETTESVTPIGQGTVRLLAAHSSRGDYEMIEGYEINPETDNVVFEAITEEISRVSHDDIEMTPGIRHEIDDLKSQLNRLQATVDSLGLEHVVHRNEFESFKNEIEVMFSNLMASDMDGMKIRIKNDEPFTPAISANLTTAYKEALDNCLTHRFDQAIEGFEAIIRNYPNSKLTENCQYWIAQSYYGMGDYNAAINGFRGVLADTRFTHKKDDASIMLGISYYLAGNQAEALVEFQKFFMNYPESEYRDKVRYWINRLS